MHHSDRSSTAADTQAVDEHGVPLRYSTGTYRAPRASADTERVYVDVLEALALLPSGRRAVGPSGR